jgi:predicted amidohydrolase
MKIACLQTRPMADFTSALAEAIKLAEQAVAEGASFLMLPEYCGGLMSDGFKLTPPHAVESNHPVLAGLRAFAAENNVWLLIGSIAITGSGEKLINRGFMIDNTGHIVSRYDKIHMFDIQLSETEVYKESATVSAGGQAVLVDTPLGCVGHSICYDLRFPQLYRDLAQAGAEVLVTPAAFTKKTGQAHWHVLNRARAIENGAFVIAPCAVGEVPGGGEAYGHSLIIAPWGEILADGGPEGCVVIADIDMAEVASARQRVPSLSHDRDYGLATPGDDTNQRNVA